MTETQMNYDSYDDYAQAQASDMLEQEQAAIDALLTIYFEGFKKEAITLAVTCGVYGRFTKEIEFTSDAQLELPLNEV